MKYQGEFGKALKKFQRYQKWRKGEIDEWSKQDRVPPNADMNEIMTAAENALKIAAHFNFFNVDISDPHHVMKITEMKQTFWSSVEDAKKDRRSSKLMFFPKPRTIKKKAR